MSPLEEVLSGVRRFALIHGACVVCDRQFEARARPSKPPRKTCSRSCQVRLAATHRSPDAYLRGPDHPAWLGDAACRRAGRTRALRLFPDAGDCRSCGKAKAERHHRDGNTLNNDPSNVEFLCRKCHAASHEGGFRGHHAR